MKRPPPEIVAHALEILAPLGEVRARAMFGGWGFYCGEHFFALVADGILYLKADAESEAAFREAGSTPFTYVTGDGRSVSMAYWSAPEAAMESPRGMRDWAQIALAAALRAKKPKKSA